MAVDDHGIEVLKKSGEEVASGDKSNYYIKVTRQPLLPTGLALELRKESRINRTIFGYAEPGAIQTDPVWYIYAEDNVGTFFHRQFAQISGAPVADFVHKWSNRADILPNPIFLNEHSVQFNNDATTNGSRVLHNSDFNFSNSDDFSWSIWFKTTSTSTQVFWQKTLSANGNNGVTVTMDSSGRIVFRWRGGGAGDNLEVRTLLSAIPSGGFRNGNWHLLIISKATGLSASTVKFYIDNIEYSTTNLKLEILSDSLTGTTTNTQPIYLATDSALVNSYRGNFDSWAVWNTELSSAQATLIWNNNDGVIDLENTTDLPTPISWWRFGDGDYVPANFPVIPDEVSTHDLTLADNLVAGDVETVVPP